MGCKMGLLNEAQHELPYPLLLELLSELNGLMLTMRYKQELQSQEQVSYMS